MLDSKPSIHDIFYNVPDIRLLQLLRIVLKKKAKKQIKCHNLLVQINIAIHHYQSATWYYINPSLKQLLNFLKVIKYIYNFFLVPTSFITLYRAGYSAQICIIYLYTLRMSGKGYPRIILVSGRRRQISCTYKHLQSWENRWLLQTTILTTSIGYITAASALTLKLGGIILCRIAQ